MATAAVRTHKRELEPHWRDALRASIRRLALRTWGVVLFGFAVATAVALASIPEQIRGYGHVKEAHLATAKQRETQLLATFRAPPDARRAAE